ncbi:kinesin-like protein KIN-12E [Eucalyptus grandis]|uniref:kinesin-like protein KIN-12E n=1 Tax=Eucalyptus grandis TaxID=71139 RepID=UPI00192E8404|nr:kinesin-like protein KIN-12E [Eucalyptus grandis]
MVIISDTASATKGRFGFHDRSSDPALSDLTAKSASAENLAHSRDQDDGGVGGGGSGSSSRGFELREDPSFWKDHNVQVIIRIRPLSSSEISLQGYGKCIRQESGQTLTWTGHPESRFTFDVVADETVSQEKLFKVAGVPMVENCVGGYNSCMFAYGQTGSGKTHTMLGDIEGGTRRHSVNCGMTPRVFEYLFSRIQKEKEARKEEKLRFTCKCSFLEIYNEQILDLLDPSSSNLQIREDIKKGIHVENLKEIEVTSAREVILQLIQGAANRKVAATNMNRASSRSHSVFTCAIESKWESQGVTHHRFARLNLVDLAGSERQKSSGAEGERLKEATNINKSLSTLGLVIMNLVSLSNGKSLHVPYRDSKLTFLLQDSLGGNSKTIIIANISPSNCCSLETLSTLKFAQRAKFIKNNAIINEDASGDVIAMRMQIQHLKKEVSRLRSLQNGGGENFESDGLSTTFPGSPGFFKWEGFHGSSTPLTSNKRTTIKDYEVALVGAFRRENDKEIALQALASESQAALQLAKQREDEIQGLKMRLRFREAGLKRLEAVAAGKISAETHLLKEKEEHLKEIEVLKTQVDRNPEVTRFAMENLQLKEEIRRLKSFCEGGEREMMNEQIRMLQNKLLEALDWKLMHESDASAVQKPNSDAATDILGDETLLLSTKEGGSPWLASVNDENEFLRLQAIQNQAELEALRKKLNFCLEEKEKLERHVNDLLRELEENRSSRAIGGNQPLELPSSSTGVNIVNFDDQIELKTMVDAIAVASQREAKAHESAMILSKENDELRMKLKVLIEDNNKLIELYEKATAERNESHLCSLDCTHKERTGVCKNDAIPEPEEGKLIEMKKAVENLEHQLVEMHEENEELMGLYEKAMKERDDFKRMLYANEQVKSGTKGEFDCPEKLVEVDAGNNHPSSQVTMSTEKTHVAGVFAPEARRNSKAIYCTNNDNSEVLREETGDQKVNGGPGADEPPSNANISISKEEATQLMKPFMFDGSDILNENSGLCVFNAEVGSKQSSEETGDQKVNGGHGADEPPSNSNVSISMEDATQLMMPFVFDGSDILNENSGFSVSKAELGSKQCSEVYQADSRCCMEIDPSTFSAVHIPQPQKVNLVRLNLASAEEKLSFSSRTADTLHLVEKSIFQAGQLSRQIEEMEASIQVDQQNLESCKCLLSEAQERVELTDKKFSALKHSLSSFSSSMKYFEQREARAKARVNASTSYLDQKNKEMARLQACKDDLEVLLGKNQQSDEELRRELACLKSKLEEEKQKQENEKVLLAIDNVEKVDLAKRNWGSKATDLLHSEEEKTKLQTEINCCRERLGDIKKEYVELSGKHGKVDDEIRAVRMEITKASRAVEETEIALHGVIKERESLSETIEYAQQETQSLILSYHQHVCEIDLREKEVEILQEEMHESLRRLEELKEIRATSSQRNVQLLGEINGPSCLSGKMQLELRNAMALIQEAKSLL